VERFNQWGNHEKRRFESGKTYPNLGKSSSNRDFNGTLSINEGFNGNMENYVYK